MAILRKDRDKAVEASSRYEAIANDTTVVRLRHQLAAQKRAAKSEAKKANARVHVAESCEQATQRQLDLATRLAKSKQERQEVLLQNLQRRAQERMEVLQRELVATARAHVVELDTVREHHAAELASERAHAHRTGDRGPKQRRHCWRRSAECV